MKTEYHVIVSDEKLAKDVTLKFSNLNRAINEAKYWHFGFAYSLKLEQVETPDPTVTDLSHLVVSEG